MEICRVCESTEIFLDLTLDINQYALQKLQTCTNIMFDVNDELPKFLCEKCNIHLNIAHNFKMRCEQTDAKFRNAFQLQNGMTIEIDLIEPQSPANWEKEYFVADVDNDEIPNELILPASDNDNDDDYEDYEQKPDEIEWEENAKEMREIVKDNDIDSVDSLYGDLQKCYGKLPQKIYHKFLASTKISISESKPKPKPHENMDLNEHVIATNEDEENEGEEEEQKQKDEKLKSSSSKKISQHSRSSLHSKINDNNDDNDDNDDEDEDYDGNDDAATPFKCSKCSKSYSSRAGLRKHIRIIHDDMKVHTCPVCKLRFSYISYLKIHMASHLGKHSCDKCPQTFQTGKSLAAHKRKIHRKAANDVENSGRKNFICDLCGKISNHKVNHVQHMRRHTGERPYECTLCSKTFRLQNSLRVHLRVHTGEKPYGCDICDMRFRQDAHLITHKLKHSGIRRHKCLICSKAFAMRNNLETHMRIHTGETPYKCLMCDGAFRDHNALKRHKRVHQ